jgi:hypothetical protein
MFMAGAARQKTTRRCDFFRMAFDTHNVKGIAVL